MARCGFTRSLPSGLVSPRPVSADTARSAVLENEAGHHLHNARGAVPDTVPKPFKLAGKSELGGSRARGAGKVNRVVDPAELRVVENVEGVGAQIHAQLLPLQRGALLQGQIPVVQSRVPQIVVGRLEANAARLGWQGSGRIDAVVWAVGRPDARIAHQLHARTQLGRSGQLGV